MLRIPINTYIYITRPSRSLTESDGLSTHHRPQNSRQNRKHAEITLKSSLNLVQIGKQRKTALYIALCRPSQARNRRKTHEFGTKSALDLSNKNVKKLYKVTFF